MSDFTGRPGDPAPAYASGRYYTPEGQFANAGTAMAIGELHLTPAFVRRGVQISALLVRLETLAAGGNFQIALYAADPASGMPTGAPLFSSASQSTAAAGMKEVAAALTLSRGRYWLAINSDNATAVFTSNNNSGTGYSSLAGHSGNANLMLVGATITGLFKAQAFNTWPTFTGNAVTDGLADTTVRSPMWGFKAA